MLLDAFAQFSQALGEEEEALFPEWWAGVRLALTWVLVFVLSPSHSEVLGKLFLHSLVRKMGIEEPSPSS
jgi:hypothetical protein